MNFLEVLGAFALFLIIVLVLLWSFGGLKASVTIEK